jgi:hypothetical protein
MKPSIKRRKKASEADRRRRKRAKIEASPDRSAPSASARPAKTA